MTPRVAIAVGLTVVAGIAGALGCAYYEDRALPVAQPEQITASVSYTIHGDTACAPNVRADVERSGREWGSVSRGHIAYRFVWDLSAGTVLQYSEVRS